MLPQYSELDETEKTLVNIKKELEDNQTKVTDYLKRVETSETELAEEKALVDGLKNLLADLEKLKSSEKEQTLILNNLTIKFAIICVLQTILVRLLVFCLQFFQFDLINAFLMIF